MNTFSPTEAIKFGWKTFMANPGFLIGLILLVYFLEMGIFFILGFIPKSSPSQQAVSFFLGIFAYFVAFAVSLGLIKALLQFVNTGKGSFSDLFSEIKNFSLMINYFLGSILVGLIILGGFIFLIIPGIYFSIRLGQFQYFLIDKNMGALEAIKASWNATEGNVMNLIGFGFLSFGVEFLGFIALIVGLLAAIPIVMVASVYVYKMLSQNVSVPVAEQPAASTPPEATVS